MLVTEISGKISVPRTRTLGRGEEPLLSSGWTLIGSELSSPNFNSSVRADRSFAIPYLNVVIKPLCGNVDICLTTRLTRMQPKVKNAFLDCAFWPRNLADFRSTRMHLLAHAAGLYSHCADNSKMSHNFQLFSSLS